MTTHRRLQLRELLNDYWCSMRAVRLVYYTEREHASNYFSAYVSAITDGASSEYVAQINFNHLCVLSLTFSMHSFATQEIQGHR